MAERNKWYLKETFDFNVLVLIKQQFFFLKL